MPLAFGRDHELIAGMARPFPRLVARSWRAYRSLRSGAGHSRVGQSPSIPPYVQGLLRARRERPRRRAADERDELTPFQLIELHSFPASQRHVTGYRIASDQSAAMLEFCNTLGSAYAGGRPPTTHSAR